MRPGSETTGSEQSALPLLEVSHLSKAFPVRGGFLGSTIAHVRAVDDVSFVLHAGEVLAVVGESGCGKSTVAQLLMHLIARDQGSIHLEGAASGPGTGFGPSAQTLHADGVSGQLCRAEPAADRV